MWVAFFLFYGVTTDPDILPADSGEFQLVTARWGIAHPPGYPLYTMAGAIWSRLFRLGSFPFRANLFSAVIAATCLLLVYKAVVKWCRKCNQNAHSAQIGGLGAVLLLGSAGTFWAQATIANIRMPAMLFTAWGFCILADYDGLADTTSRNSVLHRLAIIIGLGIGHHPSLLFVMTGWIVYLALCDGELLFSPGRWPKIFLITLCAWAIPQLYLPLRDSMSNVPFSPGNLLSWQGFWGHVLARGFSGDMFAYATVADLALRLPLIPSLLRFQFPWTSIGIMIIGLVWLFLKHNKFALSVFIAWIVHTFVTITYRAPQTIEYLMPAYIPMVLVFGVTISGIWSLGSFLLRRIPRLPTAAVTIYTILLISRMVSTVPDFAYLAAQSETRLRTEPLLNAAPEQALILADWRWVTPLWTMQHLENNSSAVEVRYVFPESPKAYDQVWLERVNDAAGRPIFTTHKYDWPGWNFAPVGGGFRLYQQPLRELPPELGYNKYNETIGNIRILGYRIIGTLQPGKPVEVHIAWQTADLLTSPPSITVRLWDEEDTLLAASDRFLGNDSQIGEIRFSQFYFSLPFDRCVPQLKITLGVYTVEQNTFNDLGTNTLASIPMQCIYPDFPPIRTWFGYFAFGGPFVRGIDYDMQTSTSGAVYIHLSGPGAAFSITSDNRHITVPDLGIGESMTVYLPFAGGVVNLEYERPDGSSCRYIGLPFPVPEYGERYVPFGEDAILVSSTLKIREQQTILILKWLSARPLAADYVVSARLGSEAWEFRHDMQPGLGALPTLKWVTRKSQFLDPHPFDDTPSPPEYYAITAYDPFRMAPLITPYGVIVRYTLP
ncbi:MAG: DUF2723 domain-containing protein [Anaerolineae bacterium]|nr:DUF2723 domain-containing protein [Anaerolineae bacterium]